MIKLTDHPLLPVEKYAEQLRDALKNDGASLLLSAEPGAGKSTIVPLVFLDAPWRKGKIIMLEPRRIAARAAAARMSELLGEKTGTTAGYRTGLDSLCGKDTVIEVVTEAILTRMLQQDPELPGVDLIIFDEFHERSIHADLGLALALDVKENLRNDLRLAVMSATLDLPALQKLLADARTIHIPGRMFPVRTIYSDILPVSHTQAELAKCVAGTVRNALRQFPGDVLVFLPGEAEIRRCCAALDTEEDKTFDILPLYGSLSPAEQDKVFRPPLPGRRKVIAASAIAETSLTIDGVRIVIDAGFMRVPVFSPASSMNRLETIRITADSAEQRKGRAGRTSDGVCIRLWSNVLELIPHRPPEIMESDLCELALELLNWGVLPEQVASLPFPDPPPPVHLRQAVSVLKGLGAIREDGCISPHGKKLLTLPVHPRLGQMLLQGQSESAVRIAALLSERRDSGSADIAQCLGETERNSAMKQTAVRLRKLIRTDRNTENDPGILLGYAYPDRIARRRNTGSQPQYVMANGITAELSPDEPLSRFEYLAVGETSTVRGQTRIRLAAALTEEDVYRIAKENIEIRREAVWDSSAGCVRCYELEQLGSLTLKRRQLSDPPEDMLQTAFLEGIRYTGEQALGLSKKENGFRERVTFLHRNGYAADYPDYSGEALLDTLEDWLLPYISGFKRLDELKKLNCRTILENNLSPKALTAMRELAPEKITVPSGSSITVDYSDPDQPAVSVRLQEIFGMKATPRIAGGKVAVLMDILSPAMRTVQKTRDLESFWKESYFLVRKDMRGRYPKHDWPEDPANAVPHRGVKRKNESGK